MPTHYGNSSMAKNTKTMPKKKKVEVAKTGSKGNMTDAMKKKLQEHSKAHEGGMKGKHMRNMVKFIKQGDTFGKAHSKAKKLDKESKPMKEGNKGKLTAGQKKLPVKLQKLIMKKKK
mgnify:CR=1 FL=1